MTNSPSDADGDADAVVAGAPSLPLPSLDELESAVLSARDAGARDGVWLILSALPSELRRTRGWLQLGRVLPPFAPRRRLPPPFAGRLVGRDVVLASVGMGTMAGENTPLLLEVVRADLRERNIAGALIVGFGGGLDPAMRAGDVAIADPCVDAVDATQTCVPDATLLAVLAHTCVEAAIEHKRAPVVTTPMVVESPADKRALADRADLQRDGVGPIAVDMETAAIAGALSDAGVPWAAARAVFDAADEVMPRALAPMALAAGPLAAARMTWILLTHPWLLPRLPSLGRANARATRRLHRLVLSFLMFAPYRESATAPAADSTSDADADSDVASTT